MVKIEKIISLDILELRAENPPTIVVVCHYRLSFWSNSPTRPYGARNGPLRCTMGYGMRRNNRSLARTVLKVETLRIDENSIFSNFAALRHFSDSGRQRRAPRNGSRLMYNMVDIR